MKLAVLCGRDTVQVLPDGRREITLDDAELAGERIGAQTRRTPFFVQIQTDDVRIVVFANGRMLIHGLQDVATGRKWYHRLFG